MELPGPGFAVAFAQGASFEFAAFAQSAAKLLELENWIEVVRKIPITIAN